MTLRHPVVAMRTFLIYENAVTNLAFLIRKPDLLLHFPRSGCQEPTCGANRADTTASNLTITIEGTKVQGGEDP